MSRGPVPLDSYRVSHITGLVKHFFDFFYLFLTFFVSLPKRHAGYYLAISTPRYARRWVAHGVAGRQAGRRAAHGAAGRRAAGRAAGGSWGGRQGGRQGGRRLP